MTAFDGHLVAIAWEDGLYRVESPIDADLDDRALEADGRLQDVSADHFYIDEAAILAKVDLPKYFLPDGDERRSEAVNWHQGLSKDVSFVLYHRAQWESGFGD